MDAKDLRTETALSERSSNGNTSNYAHNSISFQCTDKNKSYHDIDSNSLPKVDVQTTRPCAVIGPDRILPQPISVNNPYMKRGHAEPWQFPRPPEYPQKMTEYQQLTRNISPRQTFQENMQRIMVPPRPLALEDTNFVGDKSDSLTKNIPKLNMPSGGKYCDVPYTVNPLTNEKSVKSSVSNMNPSLMRGVWPQSGVNVRPARPYGAPELYQYPDYSNCAAPHTMPVNRSLQGGPEEPVHMYSDPYRGGNIRYEPYPSVKERNPRYEYINYSNPYPPPHFPPHKYDVQKLGGGVAMPPQSYASYPQVPLKYVREPHVYQRSPNPQPNYNVPYHNQGVYHNYGSIPGNCLPNKLYGYPTESSYNPAIAPKPPYDNNKQFIKYDNIQMRHYATPENLYMNEISRSHHMKTPLSMSGQMNMHTLPTYPNYRKDNMPIRHYDLSGQYKNMDPTYNTQMTRISSQFSPVDSLSSENNSFGISPEDCGYVSQSSTTSVRSTDSGIHMYHRYGHMNRGSPINPRNESECAKKNKSINVRQFLQMWNEGDEENSENNTNKNIIVQPNNTDAKQNSELYVLGLVNVPSEELDKYEHIQKVSKLPDNIKGYTSIDLLNQFEEVIESSNMNNYSMRTSNLKDIQKQNNSSVHIMKGANLPIRPLSPLDVESKISQSVIHKDVGCNFEIKPCSPKMLSVEVAAPVQTLMEERSIEKVTNQLIVKSPILANIEENINNCHAIKRQERRSQNREESSNVSSCKMVKTQYSVDVTRATDKSNYSIQDFESNSGVCLASLPRLDNDIELSFPEVNQQFINANKVDSEVNHNLTTSSVLNVSKPEIALTVTKDRIKSPVSPLDSEFPKLSKYRKNKNIKEVSDNTPFLSVQATRTDSVIIKNPENTGNFSEDISASISFKHAEISFNDKILSPMNLAVNNDSSGANNDLNHLSNFVKDHVNTNKSEDLTDKAVNLSLCSITQDMSNDTLNVENKDQNFELNTESSPKSSPENVPKNNTTNYESDRNSEERNHFTVLQSLIKNNEDEKEFSSLEAPNSEHKSDDKDNNTETDLNKQYKINNGLVPVEIDEKLTNYLDPHTDNEKLYQLLEERVNDLPENLLTPLSESTINDVSQDSIISDNDLENTEFHECKNVENLSEPISSLESKLEKLNDTPSTLLSEQYSDDSCKTSLQTQLDAVLIERKDLEDDDSYSVITNKFCKHQSTSNEFLLSQKSEKVIYKNIEIERDSQIELCEFMISNRKKTVHVNCDREKELVKDFIKQVGCKNIKKAIINQETINEFDAITNIEEEVPCKITKPSEQYAEVSCKLIDKEIQNKIKNDSDNEIDQKFNDNYVSESYGVVENIGDNLRENNLNDKVSTHKTSEVEVMEGQQKSDKMKNFNVIKEKMQDFFREKDDTEKLMKEEIFKSDENKDDGDNFNEEDVYSCRKIENLHEPSVKDDNEKLLSKQDETVYLESKHQHKEINKISNIDFEADFNSKITENCFQNHDNENLLALTKPKTKRQDRISEINHASISIEDSDNKKTERNHSLSTNSEERRNILLPFHKELYSSEIQKLLIFQEGNICNYVVNELSYNETALTFVNKDFYDKGKIKLNLKKSESKTTTAENVVLNNEESEDIISKDRMSLIDDNTQGFDDCLVDNKMSNLKLETTENNKQMASIILPSLQDNSDTDKKKEEFEIPSHTNSSDDNITNNNSATFCDSLGTVNQNSENCQNSKSEVIEKQKTVFSLKSNKLTPILNKRTLKRAQSESDIFNIRNNHTQDLKEAFCQSTNKSSLWPNKRKRIEDNLNDDSNSGFTVQNRRNSMSSVYHDENISFCIVIDNNCLISQEEYAEGTVCFADIQEEDFNSVVDNHFVTDDVECQPATSPPPDDEYSQSPGPESFPEECITLKDPEVNWVDDVACVETVVSDDVVDDDDVFVENITPPQCEDIFDHTNKIKNIYGDEMCSDDIHLIKTLYSTPQMDMNKTLHQDKESLILDCTKQYESECLESILSDNYVDGTKNNDSKYTKDVCSLGNGVNDLEEQIFQETYESINYVNNEELNKRDKCLEENLEGLERELSELPDVFFGADDYDGLNSCESTSEMGYLNQSVSRLKYKRSSSSPEVTSTTEEKKTGILLKITNYNGSRMSHLDNVDLDNTKRIRCKFTEDNEYSNSKTASIHPRPLLTKAAQKYIPPLTETIRDLKVKLFLPQTSLVKLKQLKICKEVPKTGINIQKHLRSGRPNFTKNITEKVKKPKPKFEDVLKSIDEIQFKMHKEKKKIKTSIPKVIIKKTENGSHYASTSNRDTFNPDLTGRKWQPWVFLEKSKFIDKMASKGQSKAVYCHRKKCYILAERFQKYKSTSTQKFIISQPNLDTASPGPLKYTIKLKPSY